MKDIKVVFMGTPLFAVPVLEGLIANYDVIGVVSQPDKIVGRKKELQPTPIKQVALKNNIKVFQPVKIKEDYEDILNLNPDVIVTCAYGQLIPAAILNYPKYKCINVHASLLPKLRGGAPIHKALIDGYNKTGITVMYMESKMDVGDIISTKETIITKDDDLESLQNRLSIMGRDLLLETLPKIINDEIHPVRQNEQEVTYAFNITREQEHINFNDKTLNIFNLIRGLSPNPGAYAMLDGKIVKIYKSERADDFYTTKEPGEIVRVYKDGIGVCTKDGEIIITDLKFEGKNRMTAKDYLNGKKEEDLLGKIFK